MFKVLIIFSFFIGTFLKYKNKKDIIPLILSSLFIISGIFLLLFVNYSDSIYRCSFISNSHLDKDSCYYNKYIDVTFQEKPSIQQCASLHLRYKDYCFFDLAEITKNVSFCGKLVGSTSRFECVSDLIKSKE